MNKVDVDVKNANPIGYISRIIFNSFKATLKKEQKQINVRNHMTKTYKNKMNVKDEAHIEELIFHCEEEIETISLNDYKFNKIEITNNIRESQYYQSELF